MKIELTKEEALILQDWLYKSKKHFNNDTVKGVFWNIECQIEKELAEPLYPNYREILANAKETVKKIYGI